MSSVGYTSNFRTDTQRYPSPPTSNLDLNNLSGFLGIQNAILASTSGGNSGLHLQVIIDGVNYKIKLENP